MQNCFILFKLVEIRLENESQIKKIIELNMKTFRFLLFTIFAIIILFQNTLAQDWPQWRGPNRDGILHDFSPPETWPDALIQKWQVNVGSGYSSPIVVNGKAFIQARKDDLEVISCVDLKTGKIIWSQSNPAPFTINQYATNQGKGPFSTPTFHNGRLYALGVNGLLSCFEVETGQLLWRKEFVKQVNTSKLFCGTSMAPVIVKDVCIVHVGDDFNGALIAYDAKTGETKWSWKEHGPGYASPIIVEIDGVRQLVTLTDKACIGVSPSNGKLLWEVEFLDEWNENIVTPVFYNGIIIVSGVRKGTFAIRPRKNNDDWMTEMVWHNQELPMYMSCPTVSENLLIGFSNKRKGQFFTLNPESGESLWQSEGRQGRNAALINAGTNLFSLDTGGALMIFKKNENELKLVKQYTVADSPTWSQPVILGNNILIKDAETLTLWNFKPEEIN